MSDRWVGNSDNLVLLGASLCLTTKEKRPHFFEKIPHCCDLKIQTSYESLINKINKNTCVALYLETHGPETHGGMQGNTMCRALLKAPVACIASVSLADWA